MILKGLFKENPIFVLLLGLCPTLAVSTSAVNALGMGLATLFVLLFSNAIISLIRNSIPKEIRIPIFITIIATFVTIVQMILAGYFPEINKSLGIYIPLIVVNCIILGRAESFASKNNVIASILDGIEKGLGFTLGLLLIGVIRELLGSGTIFDVAILPHNYQPILIMILPPGAFLTMGLILAFIHKLNAAK
jgi:Na+-translocating ferredoxin:NAD+ oxidoreductase subunit E